MEAFFRPLKSRSILLAYFFSSILYFFYKHIIIKGFGLNFPPHFTATDDNVPTIDSSSSALPALPNLQRGLSRLTIFNEAYRGSPETPASHQDFRWSHYSVWHRLASDKTLFRHLSQSHLLTLPLWSKLLGFRHFRNSPPRW